MASDTISPSDRIDERSQVDRTSRGHQSDITALSSRSGVGVFVSNYAQGHGLRSPSPSRTKSPHSCLAWTIAYGLGQPVIRRRTRHLREPTVSMCCIRSNPWTPGWLPSPARIGPTNRLDPPLKADRLTTW